MTERLWAMSEQAREDWEAARADFRTVTFGNVAAAEDRLVAAGDALAARLSSLEDERDTLLRDVLWLIDCERDAAETVGTQDAERACENLVRRIEGHFHVDAAAE